MEQSDAYLQRKWKIVRHPYSGLYQDLCTQQDYLSNGRGVELAKQGAPKLLLGSDLSLRSLGRSARRDRGSAELA